MVKRALTAVSLALASVLFAPLGLGQSDNFAKTEFGHPDLQGTYTFRTITPLNRPRELEHMETLTPEQAAEWEQFELRRQNRDLIIDSVGGAGYPPGVISYNNFWYERGENTVADRRTSLIYEPSNGRMPQVNAAGRERRSEYGQMVFESAGPEGRTLVDRCLVGFVAGPPMIPGSYNNNMQIVQTKDQIMILNEMVHTARIIRLDSEHNSKQLKWEGDSVAHWEGDTLVISTQNWYHDYNLRGMSKQAPSYFLYSYIIICAGPPQAGEAQSCSLQVGDLVFLRFSSFVACSLQSICNPCSPAVGGRLFIQTLGVCPKREGVGGRQVLQRFRLKFYIQKYGNTSFSKLSICFGRG